MRPYQEACVESILLNVVCEFYDNLALLGNYSGVL